jgi:hypothetical protein
MIIKLLIGKRPPILDFSDETLRSSWQNTSVPRDRNLGTTGLDLGRTYISFSSSIFSLEFRFVYSRGGGGVKATAGAAALVVRSFFSAGFNNIF